MFLIIMWMTAAMVTMNLLRNWILGFAFQAPLKSQESTSRFQLMLQIWTNSFSKGAYQSHMLNLNLRFINCLVHTTGALMIYSGSQNCWIVDANKPLDFMGYNEKKSGGYKTQRQFRLHKSSSSSSRIQDFKFLRKAASGSVYPPLEVFL